MSFYFVTGAEAQIPLMNPSMIIESAVRELARYRFRNNPFDLVLILLSGLYLLYRRSRMDRLVLTYIAAAFISAILLSGNKTFLYAINLYPFLMLIVAEAFISLISQTRRPVVMRTAALILILFFGYRAFVTASNIYINRDYDYYAITNPIREVVPPDARIMGMPTWWIGLSEYDYRSSLSVPYYRFFNDFNVREAIDAIRPDYIIVDGTQQVVLVDEGQTLAAGMNVYSVPRGEFIEILDNQGELVLEFSNQWHGDFQIYRLNWDE